MSSPTLIERALDDAIKHLVAFGDRTPDPDDPRWSPWTRFQKPLIDRLAAARDEYRCEITRRDAGDRTETDL